jgi:DNA-binding PadR family transcriptional regulator
MGKQSWAFGGQNPFASFAFGRRGRFFESGEIRLAVLSLINEGPKHGYQLMKELQERSNGVYRASAGSVYPTLQQLEDEGLIEAEVQNGRRVYRITAAGKSELEKESATVREIWERAEECEDWGEYASPNAIAIYGVIGMLVKASVKAAGRPGLSDRVREILERTRREVESL